MAEIHPTAIIEPGAELGEGASVGAYSVIGPDVKIGKNNRIAPHVVIEGRTTIGDNNNIFQFASVGAIPQDLKYGGEPSRLEIGDNNIVREYVTLQPGTEGGGMLTKIGNNNLFMACAHVAHDIIIGNHNILVNGAALAGHISVGNHVILGGQTGYHQFIRLGDYALVSGGSMVTKDVPPYCLAQGDRAGLAGINKIGLERAGFDATEIRSIQNAYRDVLLSSKGTYQERLQSALDADSESELVKNFLSFLNSSERGIVSCRKES